MGHQPSAADKGSMAEGCRLKARDSICAAIAAALLLAVPARLEGQRGGGAGQAAQTNRPTQNAKALAPIDLTGYWVSIITEDWRWRMVTPAKGDYQSVPINAEAKRVADLWDPAKDESAGEECKSYGAAAIMRVPGRLRITWQDDNTLKVETDAGMQMRLLQFGPAKGLRENPTRSPQRGAPNAAAALGPGRAGASGSSWQGDSVAEWEIPGGAGGRAGTQPAPGAAGGAAQAQPKFGHLKVVTTNMRSGYLRKNGIPYSENAVLTEYWDVYKEKNGDQWLVITALVDDSKYLQQQYVTSPNFKKEPDGSKWDPSPCSARW